MFGSAYPTFVVPDYLYQGSHLDSQINYLTHSLLYFHCTAGHLIMAFDNLPGGHFEKGAAVASKLSAVSLLGLKVYIWLEQFFRPCWSH